MRLLITGGTGVLGRALAPLARANGHQLDLPTRSELDLFDPVAVTRAVHGVDAVLHLATRIQPLDQLDNPDAWRQNDRLRAEASRILVDAALATSVTVYVQPTVTFVYPPEGPASETTPIREVSPILRSALVAEHETERFARAGLHRRGVVLRLGLLDGPGTGHTRPRPDLRGHRCTSPTQLAPCCRLSPCPAEPTTSAATANACRICASPEPPAGIPVTTTASVSRSEKAAQRPGSDYDPDSVRRQRTNDRPPQGLSRPILPTSSKQRLTVLGLGFGRAR